MSTKLNWATETYRSQNLAAESADLESVADRQDRIPGFSTTLLQTKKVLLIGAGGLGGGIATALARKGIGEIRICDQDLVEPSNLNRQAFYKDGPVQTQSVRSREERGPGRFLGYRVCRAL